MNTTRVEGQRPPAPPAGSPAGAPAGVPALRRLAAGLRPRLEALAAEPYRSGLAAIVKKELADHLTSSRFAILGGLVALTSVASLYVAAATIRSAVGGRLDQFVFLRLFTTGGESLPSFLFFLGFLAPLVGLALGFDAINGEEARRTLPRLLSQPIHRDAVINGKFLAALITVAVALAALALCVAGLGLVQIGVPPTADEVLRLVAFYGVTVLYVAFWLSLSVLASLVFRQASTSALAGIAVWLFLSLFGSLVANLVADAVLPLPAEPTARELVRHETLRLWLSRLSPWFLYSEATMALLTPQVRSLGVVLLTDLELAVLDGPLPPGQTLVLIWPHLMALFGATLALFAVSYVLFMRREVRA